MVNNLPKKILFLKILNKFYILNEKDEVFNVKQFQNKNYQLFF